MCPPQAGNFEKISFEMLRFVKKNAQSDREFGNFPPAAGYSTAHSKLIVRLTRSSLRPLIPLPSSSRCLDPCPLPLLRPVPMPPPPGTNPILLLLVTFIQLDNFD